MVISHQLGPGTHAQLRIHSETGRLDAWHNSSIPHAETLIKECMKRVRRIVNDSCGYQRERGISRKTQVQHLDL